MLDKKVSIILPVYNAEDNIKKCINTIINQTYSNFELIIVNDGSTDKSQLIIKEYLKVDKRIKSFYIDNSGPSAARNFGINVAEGEYIQFVDADDYLKENMIEKLAASIIFGSDLVICGYKSEFFDRNELNKVQYDFTENKWLEKKEFTENFGRLFKDYYINYPWNKLYKTNIIKKNSIQFDVDIKWGEDLIFNLEYLKHCKKMSFVREDLYVYNQRNSSSITSSYNKLFFDNQSVMYEETINYLCNESAFHNQNRRIIYDKISIVIITSLLNLVHKEADLTIKEKLYNINRIIVWEKTEEALPYYKNKSIKEKVMGKLIENKSIIGIFVLIQFWALKNRVSKLN